jgi:hypothetical protein
VTISPEPRPLDHRDINRDLAVFATAGRRRRLNRSREKTAQRGEVGPTGIVKGGTLEQSFPA